MSIAATNSMTLRELFDGIVVDINSQLPDLAVTDITADSGRVSNGSLFLACRGMQYHGLEFAVPAVAAGAAAIAWEPA